MRKHEVVDIAFAIVVVAGVLVLVRPGSKGPQFVTAIGNAFTGALTVVTGQVPNRPHGRRRGR